MISKNKTVNSLMLFIAVSVLSTAIAQTGGLTQINSIFENVISMLQSLSVPVITIAILWVAKKYAFDGASIRDCAPILIGGVLISSAPYLAQMLVGS